MNTLLFLRLLLRSSSKHSLSSNPPWSGVSILHDYLRSQNENISWLIAGPQTLLAQILSSQFLPYPQCGEKDKLFVKIAGKTPYMLMLSLQRPPVSPSNARYSSYMKLTLSVAELARICDARLTGQAAVQ